MEHRVAAEIERRRRGPLPREVRDTKRCEALELLASGASIGAVAQAVGVHRNTVHLWRSAARKASPFLRVDLAEPANASAGGQLSRISPAGYRVEGLGLGEIAFLLRTLG